MGPKLILLLGLALLILIDCGKGAPENSDQSLIARAKTDASPQGRRMITLNRNRRHNKRHCSCKGYSTTGKNLENAVCPCNTEKRKSKNKQRKKNPPKQKKYVWSQPI